MTRGPDPAARLRDVRVPGEEEAEQRSWEIVRTAYEERTPARLAHRARPLALALGGGLAALAIVLSPAGAKVGDLVSDVVGIGEEDAKPALRSLPAAGELLVESEQGPWIVREDGSKRLLGDYEEASWSQPRGLYVAATDGRTLLAVEPDGTVRWTITAPAPVHDPRWAPSGVRVAYRSAGDLWIVNGDGSDPRRIARNVGPTAPQWLPPSAKAKIAPAEAVDLVAYIDRRGKVRVVSGDSGTPIPNSKTYQPSLHELKTDWAIGPDGAARIERRRGRSRVVVAGGGTRSVLLAKPGRLTGPTWSPDGHWLLVGWPAADQWLFIPIKRSDEVIPIDSISEQFAPGATGAASFPRVSGWILPQR